MAWPSQPVASGQISLADLRGKSSVPPAPTVNANPRMFNVTRSTVAAAQTINSDSALTVSGGVAPVTLSIALISGSGISGSIIAGTTARLTSSAPRNSAGARTATFRVTATDNLGRTGTVDISATHEYTSNA